MPPAALSRRLQLALALAAHLGAIVAVTSYGPRQPGTDLFGLIVLSWVTFASAALVLARTPIARPVLVVGVLAAVLQVPGVLVEAQTSTDSLRYVWDGRVQLSGTSPYRYPPSDPALADLRDPILFPGGEPALNRPTVHTIYPPVAQAWFTVVAAVTPVGVGTLGVRIATAGLAVAVAVLLSWLLRRSRQDPRWAAVWGWCPLVVLEAGNNAHVDVLSAAFVVLAFIAQSARRHRWAGLALGLAIGVKLVPILLAPVIARERPVRVCVGEAGTLAVVYLPHVLVAGSLVLGYLPGYVREEGYDGRTRFAMLRVLLPEAWAVGAAVVIAVTTAILAARHTDPRRPWDTATWLLGVALLLACPPYAWYALPLVACVALSRRWEWLAVALAGYPVYLADDYAGPGHAVQEWSYGLAALVVIAGTMLRQRHRFGSSPPLLDRLVTGGGRGVGGSGSRERRGRRPLP